MSRFRFVQFNKSRLGHRIPKSCNVSPGVSKKPSFERSTALQKDIDKLPVLRLNKAFSPARTRSNCPSPAHMRELISKHTQALMKQALITKICYAFASTGSPPKLTKAFYRKGKILGTGAFGNVRLATHILTGRKVAIKSIRKNPKLSRKRKAYQEAKIMNTLNSVYIVRLFEVYQSRSHINLAIEYVNGCTLLELLKTKQLLSEKLAKNLFIQIVWAVVTCHQAGIAHRDIKLENILISNDFATVKLCDFGVSCRFMIGEKVKGQCGTPVYLAPEVVADIEYEPWLVDIWTLGVVLFIMVTGKPPFHATGLAELHKQILQADYSLPQYLSEDVKNLIFHILQPIPSKRLSTHEILTHPWLEDSFPPLPTPPLPESTFIDQVTQLGFPLEYIQSSLSTNDLNHAIATLRILSQN